MAQYLNALSSIGGGQSQAGNSPGLSGAPGVGAAQGNSGKMQALQALAGNSAVSNLPSGTGASNPTKINALAALATRAQSPQQLGASGSIGGRAPYWLQRMGLSNPNIPAYQGPNITGPQTPGSNSQLPGFANQFLGAPVPGMPQFQPMAGIPGAPAPAAAPPPNPNQVFDNSSEFDHGS